jgi:hypothetical protein
MKRTMSGENFRMTFTASGSAGTGVIELGHGTDIQSAHYIAQSGVNYEMALRYGDGSFWATPDMEMAAWFAYVNPATGPPALVKLKIQTGVIDFGLSSSPPSIIDHGNQAFEFQRQSFQLLNTSVVDATIVVL